MIYCYSDIVQNGDLPWRLLQYLQHLMQKFTSNSQEQVIYSKRFHSQNVAVQKLQPHSHSADAKLPNLY